METPSLCQCVKSYDGPAVDSPLGGVWRYQPQLLYTRCPVVLVDDSFQRYRRVGVVCEWVFGYTGMPRSLFSLSPLASCGIFILIRPVSTGYDTPNNGSINLPPSRPPCALNASETANLELGGGVDLLGKRDMVPTWKKKRVWGELFQCCR